MKKLFIICLSFMLMLTSCDLDYITDWIKAPDTEDIDETENQENPKLPRSEAYTLSELVNKDDILYIEFQITFYLDSTQFANRHITYNIDGFFDLFFNKNSDLQFISNIDGVYDLYDEIKSASIDLLYDGEHYVNYTLFDTNGNFLADGTIYPDSMIEIYVFNSSPTYFISTEPSSTDVNTFIDYLSTLI